MNQAMRLGRLYKECQSIIQCEFKESCFSMTSICKRCIRNESADNPELDFYEDLSYIVTESLTDIDSTEFQGILCKRRNNNDPRNPSLLSEAIEEHRISQHVQSI